MCDEELLNHHNTISLLDDLQQGTEVDEFDDQRVRFHRLERSTHAYHQLSHINSCFGDD
jgi:hypothetical protein